MANHRGVRKVVRIVKGRGTLAGCLKGDGPRSGDETQWIFIGRLLRRGVDKAILEDEARLGSVISNVFSADGTSGVVARRPQRDLRRILLGK